MKEQKIKAMYVALAMTARYSCNAGTEIGEDGRPYYVEKCKILFGNKYVKDFEVRVPLDEVEASMTEEELNECFVEYMKEENEMQAYREYKEKKEAYNALPWYKRMFKLPPTL